MEYFILIILQLLMLVLLGLQFLGKREPSVKISAGGRRTMIIDSCGFIDGRIVDVLNAGFAPDQVIVPQFIIAELQMLADGRDPHKRERARFGLDVIKQLQDSNTCEVTITSELKDSPDPTDHKLVQLAKRTKAVLYTTDYNLNKVADIEGVKVLNINELAQSIRPTALPGERRTVKIIQKGSGADQGVGYLNDGTMIVINGASKAIGKTVEVEISRTFQTVAGKMLFASIISNSTLPPQPTAAKLIKSTQAKTSNQTSRTAQFQQPDLQPAPVPLNPKPVRQQPARRPAAVLPVGAEDKQPQPLPLRQKPRRNRNRLREIS